MGIDFDNIAGKAPGRVAVIGAAKSGVAAAQYFRARGSAVFISDTCSRERLDGILRGSGLDVDGVESESDRHSDKVLSCELIILSPGVRSDLDVLVRASAKGIPVWSEMELGFRVSKAPFLAVTGSSGKSTTVSLLASAMTGAGFETALVGNIGTPVIGVTPNLSGNAVVVAEVSSFQLETIDRFKPKVASVINLMKNHLDRYSCEEEYYNAKLRIADNLTRSEYLVLNSDDVRLSSWAKELSKRTNIIMFGTQCSNNKDCVFLSGNSIHYQFNGSCGEILDDVMRMKISGRHNHINACAAAAIALAGGAMSERIARGLCNFAGLPHRLEYVTEINGIKFYNDSKSTTAESIECAVNAFGSKSVQLIAGGKDKGCDFSVIGNSLRSTVKNIVLLGEAKDRMSSQWEGIAPIHKTVTLEDAVSTAFNLAAAGDRVVFSPGCSSFDMFKNFEHRGEMFRETVNELASRKAC
ncbi:MAG: UDP-N-acetylmuramoyl-L-alanine--D-glutamate ligase [Chitinispirillia bacterium]|nr:UDP-N-acetylmuramoyl-L-alanine--D-glutamate ligase [Chitinispirillia bacterium]MCL2267803.1 UDP-N-acetylmuramoyl-L-alanine--D-glutamate ligase [Chitinispirillia bacterium]